MYDPKSAVFCGISDLHLTHRSLRESRRQLASRSVQSAIGFVALTVVTADTHTHTHTRTHARTHTHTNHATYAATVGTGGEVCCSCMCCRRCVEVNECDTFPCDPFGDCVDLVNDYVCYCRPGFTQTGDPHFCDGQLHSRHGTGSQKRSLRLDPVLPLGASF